MIKVLLDQSCFDKNGLVILGTVVDAILQATGAERVTIYGELGRLWKYRSWPKPSISELRDIKAHRLIDVSTRERWNVVVESALWDRVRWGVQRGILKPHDNSTAYLLLQHGEADAVVALDDLNAWGKAVGNYEFERTQAEGACAGGDQNADSKPSHDGVGKASTGTTAGNDYVQPQEEPKMRCGRNARAECLAWCAYMAKSGKFMANTRNKLAEKIKEEADRRNYRMQMGDNFSIAMIVSAIPRATTGTRQNNRKGGKSAFGRR